LDAEVAATPNKLSPGNWQPPQPGCGAGLGTCFQVLPSQCSISVVDKMLLLPAEPTAQALDAEVAATAVRPPPWLDGDGLRTRLPPLTVPVQDQGMAADGDLADCPGVAGGQRGHPLQRDKAPPKIRAGTLDQALPSQRSISALCLW
jgi:hypothetical protein